MKVSAVTCLSTSGSNSFCFSWSS